MSMAGFRPGEPCFGFVCFKRALAFFLAKILKSNRGKPTDSCPLGTPGHNIGAERSEAPLATPKAAQNL